MIIPEVGPQNNAVHYGHHDYLNRQAEFFHHNMTSSAFLEPFAEVVRSHPEAHRSDHPLLSFCGIGAEALLEGQSLSSPLEPIRNLADEDGDILLVGTDHTTNISIHYAEQTAGRRSFTRWALTSAVRSPAPVTRDVRKGSTHCEAGLILLPAPSHSAARWFLSFRSATWCRLLSAGSTSNRQHCFAVSRTARSAQQSGQKSAPAITSDRCLIILIRY